MLFLDAPGGTGKTFVLIMILAKLRMEGKVVIAVASSGIAATLLDGDRTAQAIFKLPLDLTNNENQVGSIAKRSGLAQLLQRCDVIVWDECTMAHKRAWEALNPTLLYEICVEIHPICVVFSLF